ncbi:MAG TPA: hypothetical protein VF147_00430 [Vicinamibacterales bacterium]
MSVEPLRYQPTAKEVDALIDAASAHALGLDFLRGGHLGTVAITFKTHAFTVVAAREKLAARASTTES